MTALGSLAYLTRQHFLVFDSYHNVDACECGYPADDSDEGHGDSVVAHLLEVAWQDGYLQGVADVPRLGRQSTKQEQE